MVQENSSYIYSFNMFHYVLDLFRSLEKYILSEHALEAVSLLSCRNRCASDPILKSSFQSDPPQLLVIDRLQITPQRRILLLTPSSTFDLDFQIFYII